MKFRFIFLFIATCTILACKTTQVKKTPPASNTSKPAGMTGNTEEPPGKPPTGPKPYSSIITSKAVTTKGLFTVHTLDSKYFFEIPDSLSSRDVLIQTRISKAGADMRSGTSGYAGDEISTLVVRFEKTNDNKIFVRKISYAERSLDSTQPMFQSIVNSTIQPIIMTFDIKAIKKDSLSSHVNWVIDVTDVVNGENDLFWGNKAGMNIVGYQSDKSYLVSIKTFPFNTEIKAVKTYMKGPGGGFPGQPGGGQPRPVTMELNSSIVLLPEVPMQPRYADNRVGYFTTGYTDFDANPQGIKSIQMIARWRLEAKDGDIEKYKRGELVEPKKPIIIYIDPATPTKWVPYLIQGINDWQSAFEQAGFKNAIRGERAPTKEEDSTWSLDDARHSALVYKPSSVANAMGPHTSDPRSGEIIETHISWFHNIMKLLQMWYMIQAGPSDTAARKMKFDDGLMGELIRFVSSHEVGHTLGLMHNFGSSTTIPAEKLRNKQWVEANGHTPSIMDYARFNYVAQPEDNISRAGLFPRIGVYDKWAIEWGYRWIPEAKTPAQEIPVLNKWVMKKLTDKRYWFSGGNDSRALTEDLGDNAMVAGTYGIKNLKRIVPQLKNWTKDPDGQYENLATIYNEVVGTFNRYMGHVTANIGGQYRNIKTEQETGPVFQAAPASLQKQALVFLNENLFTTPQWLIDTSILLVTGQSPLDKMKGLQEGVMNNLLDRSTFTNFMENEMIDAKAYRLVDYMKDLQNDVWKELAQKKPIDIYRRNLQKLYVQRLIGIINPAQPQATGPGMPAPKDASFSEETAIARAELGLLRNKLKTAIPLYKDAMSKYHLQDMADGIGNALKIK